jgi:hypothetical protein
MSTVGEIKQAIEKLPVADFLELSRWVLQRRGDEWDKQIEQDINAGRLDALAEEALNDLKAGRTRPFPE